VKKLALALFFTSALSGCAGPDARLPNGTKPIANPSAVVATELAFAREAQEKGQWTAFAKYAADDAVMFVPQPVKAKEWLKKQSNPAQAVRWQPYAVWMSCDGSLAVTKGAWQRPNGTNGYFTTVWRRQKDGSYKWTLDQGDTLAEPLAPPDMISGRVADCSRPSPPDIPTAPGRMVGWSIDKSLQWIAEVRPDGSRTFKAHRWTGSGYEEVVRSEVAAE
jgi:ketosteroid isomerase-like protein